MTSLYFSAGTAQIFNGSLVGQYIQKATDSSIHGAFMKEHPNFNAKDRFEVIEDSYQTTDPVAPSFDMPREVSIKDAAGTHYSNVSSALFDVTAAPKKGGIHAAVAFNNLFNPKSSDNQSQASDPLSYWDNNGEPGKPKDAEQAYQDLFGSKKTPKE